jgi:hypothetical protein
MDFTKGEIFKMKLRLIASAYRMGPLIAGSLVCDEQTRPKGGGD